VTPVPTSFAGGIPNGVIDPTPIGYGYVFIGLVVLKG
jgi:hypothetical protein